MYWIVFIYICYLECNLTFKFFIYINQHIIFIWIIYKIHGICSNCNMSNSSSSRTMGGTSSFIYHFPKIWIFSWFSASNNAFYSSKLIEKTNSVSKCSHRHMFSNWLCIINAMRTTHFTLISN